MTAQQSTKQKKGQIQLNETIFVLFIILIIIFVGLFVYYKYSIASIQETAATLTEEEITILLATIPAMPELKCDTKPCLDTGKFIPFKTLTETKPLHYAQVLGTKTIKIEQLYPAPTTEGECTLAKYQQASYPANCNHWILYENKLKHITSTPILSTVVSLYYPETDTYSIGRLTLEVYL